VRATLAIEGLLRDFHIDSTITLSAAATQAP
jgi:hypothetical protein